MSANRGLSTHNFDRTGRRSECGTATQMLHLVAISLCAWYALQLCTALCVAQPANDPVAPNPNEVPAQVDAAQGDVPLVDAASVKALNVGRFVTLTTPLGESAVSTLRRAALELADEARRQGKQAILIIGVPSGTCDFTHAYAVGEFLTSDSLAGVKTVAWVEGDSTGPGSLIALACSKVLMHPNARIGDLGKGQSLTAERLEIALQMTRRSGNPLASEALTRAMGDMTSVVVKVEWMANGTKQSRVITDADRARLVASGVEVLDVRNIKERGAIAAFTGTQAEALGIIVNETAENRRAVVDLLKLPLETLREKLGAANASVVRVIPIQGMIDEQMRAMWSRHIQTALDDGAELIIFEIDSGGGYQYDSEEMAKEIASLEDYGVRTVAYVPKMAYSGAALIAMGCDELYLHPKAQFGDIGQIVFNPAEGIINHAPAKMLSPLLVTLKDLADQKHRPAALAMSMADKNLPVFEVRHVDNGSLWYMDDDEILAADGQWIKGRVVPETKDERFMTVNGSRAHTLLMAGPTVENVQELHIQLGLPANVQIRRLEQTWVDGLALTLNHWFFAGLLIVLGVICLVVELHLPSGFFGMASALFFGLFFWSKMLGGTAGMLEVTLFLIGLGCLALELFVTPGFGVLGVSGLLLIFASLFMASQTFGNSEPGRDLSQAFDTGIMLAGAMGTVIVLSVLLSRFLPSIPLLNSIILAPPGASSVVDERPRLRREVTESEQALLGLTGVAITTLRPAGKAMVGDRLLDVVSAGGYIDEGTAIEITEVIGPRIVVSRVEA